MATPRRTKENSPRNHSREAAKSLQSSEPMGSELTTRASLHRARGTADLKKKTNRRASMACLWPAVCRCTLRSPFRSYNIKVAESLAAMPDMVYSATRQHSSVVAMPSNTQKIFQCKRCSFSKRRWATNSFPLEVLVSACFKGVLRRKARRRRRTGVVPKIGAEWVRPSKHLGARPLPLGLPCDHIGVVHLVARVNTGRPVRRQLCRTEQK